MPHHLRHPPRFRTPRHRFPSRAALPGLLPCNSKWAGAGNDALPGTPIAGRLWAAGSPGFDSQITHCFFALQPLISIFIALLFVICLGNYTKFQLKVYLRLVRVFEHARV